MASLGQRLNEIGRHTIEWLSDNALELVIALLAASIIAALLLSLRRLGKKLCARDATGRGWASIIGRAVEKTSNLFIFAIAARLVVKYAAAPDFVAQPVGLLFIVAVTIQAAIWAREIVLGLIEHRTDAGEHEALGSAMGIIRLLVSVALFLVAGVVILDNVGVNVTGLIAGLGIGGIAIGLAAQGIFADLFAALSILFDRPFRRGDAIAYDQTTAHVEAIGLKSTRLRAITGEQRIISNKALLDKEIRNNSRVDYRRARFPIGLVYQTLPEKAAALPALVKDVVEKAGHRFLRAGFIGFGASSLDFELEFDVLSDDYEVFFAARHAVGIALLQRFAAEGLEFAYPTQTTFTAAPDGTLVMPYAPVQKVDAEVHGRPHSSQNGTDGSSSH